jgi:phosphohistidine phosphatase SixA
MDRRSLLLAAAALPGSPLLARASDPATDPTAAVAAALKAGGCVIAIRHALAPGTFDPPEFRIGDCATQRNLDDTGRAQARRIGAWFTDRSLVPAAVKSSPWCRCEDTARLAFGRFETWDPLGSPVRSPAAVNAGRVAAMRQALAAVPAGRFEAWVTHNFVLSDFTGSGASSGEGLVVRPGADGRPEVVARLAIR